MSFFSTRRIRSMRIRKGAWVLAPAFLISMFMPMATPAQALSPVFESTAAAKVTLGSLASRTQCAVLGKQGIGPYTMTGTDATSNSSYSYVTDKNYTQTAQLYEGQESPNQSLSYTTSTGQTYSGRNGVIQLVSQGYISYSNTCNNHSTYGSAFGPEIWSEPFPATANQSISFDWAAAGGYDDYEAYGYLVKVSASGNTYDYGSSATSTLVSYGRGQNQSWVTSTGIVSSTGYYRFRFVNGSYDATGGQALGASMYIDSAISVASANSITFAQPADIVTSSSNQTFTVSATATSGLSVTFTSSTTGKCTVGSSTDGGGTSTATVTVLASQTGTCTISTNSSANNSYVAAATVSQSFTLLAGSTAPTTSGGTSMSGTVAYGETLTAVDGTWGDGGSAVTATTYQWQSCTPSSCTWTNISGATSSTYAVGSDDVAKQIRVRVTKTNSIGSLTANSAASITVPAPTSVIVTNLSDTSGSGSLRWAITTANASATINTITFASGNTGTITLTSALPAISDNLTITGAGLTSTIIDGNNLYRPFNISSGKSLTISDMTLKRGQITNGGLIYNGAGTLSATNMRFTAMTGGAATYNGGSGSVSTFTNTTFDHLNYGIHGDYGSTPSALSLTDSDYTNRTYIYDSVFSDNYYAVYSQRFTKIDNSQFSNNTYGAVLAGLNRQQVTNSVFTSNGTTSATEGAAIYFAAWIPMGWAMGAGNQTVSGNTFNGNKIAIEFDNSWSNGSRTYNGVSANSFATISGNTFGNTSANTNNFSGSGYVESGNTITTTTTTTSSTTTTTTVAPTTTTSSTTTSTTSTTSTTTTTVPTTTTTTVYVPPVVVIPPVDTATTSTSVSPVVVTPPDDTTVPLPQLPEPETESTTVTLPVGTEPETALPGTVIPPVGTEPETVVVIIPSDEVTLPEAGEAISTGDLAGILDNAFTPDASSEEVTAVLDGLLDADLTPKQFDAVVDATLGSLEEPGADVGAVVNSFLEADLSDKEFTKVLDAVFSEDVSDEVFTEALTTMLGADLSDKELDKVLDAAFSETTSPEAMVSALSSIFDGPTSGADISKIMGAVFDEDISVEDTKAVLGDLLETTLSKSEAEAVFDNVFDSDLSDAETIDLIVDVLKDGLTAELLGSVLGAVFDEAVSTEVLIETFTAVLGNELDAESVGVIVDVLESDSITNDQVSQVVDLITGQEGGIDPGQSAELSASPKVLESITPEQATAVFAALDVTNVTPEQEAQLAEALTNAPNDIKEALEEEVDIYGEGFDDYVAVGSQVDVGARRTLIAATTAVAAITAAGAATGGPGGSGGSSGGGNSNGPSGTNNNVAKKNEEEEMAGEIAGPEDDEDSNFTKNSIFKYYIKEGIEMKEFNWLGFAKKLWDITAGLAFTFAGSVIVYYTLSGTTQMIALASTVTACVVHYTHQILKKDED